MQILNDEQVGIEMLYRNKSIQDVPFLEQRFSIQFWTSLISSS